VTFGLWLALGLTTLVAEVSVGVAPFEALGLEDAEAARLRAAAVEHLQRGRSGRRVVEPLELDRQVAEMGLDGAGLRQCLGEPSCAARLSLASGSDELVLGRAAGLGRTYILRLSLLDADRAVIDREVQETIVGDLDDLAAALPAQLDRLLPPRRRWYSSPWLWGTLIVIAAAAAAAVAIVLSTGEPEDVPVYPLP